jgi:cytochrome c551/c552
MLKKLSFWGVVMLLAVLLVGCGGSGDTSSGDVMAGEELFDQTVIGSNAGCVTCHSLEPDVVIVGPSMAAFSLDAEAEGEELGMTAEEFVRQSILDPNAVLSYGYDPDLMPTNWDEVLTDEQVDQLVAYLLSLE